jgi:hypothetical protein
MVAGRVLAHDSTVPTADEDALRAEMQIQEEAVTQLIAADPAHKRMAPLGPMKVG